LEEDDQNFILMHAVSANVSGQIGSVIIGGIILGILGGM
jgi:oxaloacetate decarboxylase beta subunit